MSTAIDRAGLIIQGALKEAGYRSIATRYAQTTPSCYIYAYTLAYKGSSVPVFLIRISDHAPRADWEPEAKHVLDFRINQRNPWLTVGRICAAIGADDLEKIIEHLNLHAAKRDKRDERAERRAARQAGRTP